MSQPSTIGINGAVVASPANTAQFAPSLQEMLSISCERTYSYKSGNSATVNNLIGSPYVVPLGSVTKVRFLALRVIGAALQVLVTSASGTDQTFKVSDLWLWHSPNEGDQLTAIKLVGTADIEYVLAGD